MQVVSAEYQFDRHKLTFYFEAERRIDFRELVRDLFAIYKTRIWLQQMSAVAMASAAPGAPRDTQRKLKKPLWTWVPWNINDRHRRALEYYFKVMKYWTIYWSMLCWRFVAFNFSWKITSWVSLHPYGCTTLPIISRIISKKNHSYADLSKHRQ